MPASRPSGSAVVGMMAIWPKYLLQVQLKMRRPCLVAEATGLSRTTIWAGRRELRRRAEQPQDDLAPERVRAPGAGRHLVEQDDATILTALRDLVESSTRGDPQSPLYWTCKSTRKL